MLLPSKDLNCNDYKISTKKIFMGFADKFKNRFTLLRFKAIFTDYNSKYHR